MKCEDISGQRFGKWTAVRYDGTDGKLTYWIFRCDCGREFRRDSTGIKLGRSNGCVKCVVKKNRKHSVKPVTRKQLKKSEANRRWRKKNPEKCKVNREKWRAKNKEWYRAYAKKWFKENERRAKDSRLKRTFGITIDEYEKLLAAQAGLCAICRRPQQRHGHKNLHVDHDHNTGKVRGLLCWKCNTTLGLVGDSAVLLTSAISYLGGHK